MPEKTSNTDLVAAVMQSADPHGHLEGLCPVAREVFTGFLCVLAYHGYGRIRVTSGSRTLQQQWTLYGRGRTAEACKRAGVPEIYARPEQKVCTWCRPEQSMHVKGMAMDVFLGDYVLDHSSPVGVYARLMGIRWGGSWKVFDPGHFELDAEIWKEVS